MSIQSKALVETAKLLFMFFVIMGGFYAVLTFFDPKTGILLLIGGIVSVFAWSVYDYYVNKFTWEEKLKD